jgi:hypothetical protein
LKVIELGSKIRKKKAGGRLWSRPMRPGEAMSKKSVSFVEHRAEELDTITAVLPLAARRVAELLSDKDVATLRQFINSLRLPPLSVTISDDRCACMARPLDDATDN